MSMLIYGRLQGVGGRNRANRGQTFFWGWAGDMSDVVALPSVSFPPSFFSPLNGRDRWRFCECLYTVALLSAGSRAGPGQGRGLQATKNPHWLRQRPPTSSLGLSRPLSPTEGRAGQGRQSHKEREGHSLPRGLLFFALLLLLLLDRGS